MVPLILLPLTSAQPIYTKQESSASGFMVNWFTLLITKAPKAAHVLTLHKDGGGLNDYSQILKLLSETIFIIVE